MGGTEKGWGLSLIGGRVQTSGAEGKEETRTCLLSFLFPLGSFPDPSRLRLGWNRAENNNTDELAAGLLH